MRKYNILIVDDEEIVVEGIKKGLILFPNYRVQTALSGELAIELCKSTVFDVVILDLVMPEMNGVEACRGIKEVSPSSEVLLLSGYPEELEKYQMEFVVAGGRDVFLRKPLLAEEISDAILLVVEK